MKTSALIKVILILSVFEANSVYGTETLYSVGKLLKLANKENHCDCTNQIKPVCGSNRRTYINKCFLECSRKKDKDLRLVANISCEEIERDEDGVCNCSEEIKPVCGSDDKTYYNICHLKCNQKYNKKLKLILRVACDMSEDQLNETEENETNEEETNSCNCSEKVQEVCASNGLTYKNECFLKCHQNSDESLTLLSNAACDKTNNYKEDCGCPNVLFPVCGSDGKTYPNKCYLKCRQKDEANLTIVSYTTCDEIINYKVDCGCADILHPVCGSDQRTYPNKCYFKCHQNKDKSLTLAANTACDKIITSEEDCDCSDVFAVHMEKPHGKTYHNKCYFKCRQTNDESLTLVSKTACDEIPNSQEDCECSNVFHPVCGSDGKTYHNKCYFKCRQTNDESLTLVSKTACDEISNSKEDCVCPDELHPVCGSDGKTYPNKCYFKCRQNDDESLTLVACYEIPKSQEDCVCPDELHPVCGSDGKTYHNKCYFKCRQTNDESLTLVSKTACDGISNSKEDCVCPDELHPVCGSDGKSYTNKCYFKCRQNDDESLTLVACYEIPNSQEDCVCPDELHPVCGSDGKTYHNKCYFKCRQNDDENLTLVSKTACDEISNSKEDCVCPDELHPVCGSDGKTYHNKCYLNCRQNDDESLTLVTKTACDEISNSKEDCVCPGELDPVCGSDGKTYHNKCYFKCRQNDDESLTLVTKTACDEISNSKEDCVCPDELHPVCGSDGKTYHNKCYFKCRQNDDESLTLVSKTACDEISNSKEDCECSHVFHPVCGSDGKTYHNKCYFNCRQNDDESLTLVTKTACDEISNSKKDCVCPDELDPVCGSDGKTYHNKCYFKCRQNDDESLTLVTKTACDEISNSKEDCVCPDELHPVCGSDGKTYHNKCYFKCRQNDDESLTLVSKTACDEISNSKEDCECSHVFHPVCGSDGKTYHNKCYFNCRQNDDESLTLVSKAACDEISNSKEDCVCPDELHPVCGSDGKTYHNKCYFNCRQNDDESLILVTKTACDEISNSKEKCVCPDELDPVCGSDGKTYHNKCYFKCRQNDDESLTLVLKTACDESLNSKEDCVCPDELYPVCGSDGKTYPNICHLKCRQNHDESLTLVSKTACDEIPSSEEDCECPDIFDPVCGSDGKTYPNICHLKCRQNDDESLTLVSKTACDEIPSPEEDCECPDILNPVCGSDGKTYANICHLKCRQNHDESLTLVSKTACDEIPSSEEDCECPDILNPVCGSDGKTYPNICNLKCRQNHDESLTLVSKTACDENPSSEEDCECPDILNPVCGSDGKTYPNICHLKCRQNHDESLTLVSKTACDEILSSEEDCECPDIFDPVCGSDGKTYPNICHLKCRHNNDESLTLVSKTACDEIPNSKEGCICPDLFHPVCGSNGKTYSNKCYFKCRQNDDENLTLVSKTACDEIPISKKDCVCPYVFDPVCGSDGKTYPNKCYFKCRQNDDENLTLVSKTSCDEIPISKEDCVCPYVFDPVCGSDKKTYSNKCLLQCSQKTDQSLKQYANTSCHFFKMEMEEAEPVTEDVLNGVESTLLHVIFPNLINLFPSICKCPLKNDPVCGSDLNTYTNPCVLNCYKKFNQDLRLDSHKACEKNKPDRPKELEILKIHRCHCSRKFKPVCATDGEVYFNFCILKCYRKLYPELKKIVRVPCEKHHKHLKRNR